MSAFSTLSWSARKFKSFNREVSGRSTKRNRRSMAIKQTIPTDTANPIVGRSDGVPGGGLVEAHGHDGEQWAMGVMPQEMAQPEQLPQDQGVRQFVVP